MFALFGTASPQCPKLLGGLPGFKRGFKNGKLALEAGPVGFEPTILGFLREQRTIVQAGSEGPRLGPGSTTGPNWAVPNSALLLSWANRSHQTEPNNGSNYTRVITKRMSQHQGPYSTSKLAGKSRQSTYSYRKSWASKLKASIVQASIYNVSKPSVIHEFKGKSRIFLPRPIQDQVPRFRVSR